MVFKISLKVIRTSVGATIYTENMFGFVLHFCILDWVKLILSYIISKYYASIEICKLLLESSHLRGSFLILHYVD